MLARRLTESQRAALKPGQSVLWLLGGGTQALPATFTERDKNPAWCWIKLTEADFEEHPRRVRLTSLGTPEGPEVAA
jgi:hypothetical protein